MRVEGQQGAAAARAGLALVAVEADEVGERQEDRDGDGVFGRGARSRGPVGRGFQAAQADGLRARQKRSRFDGAEGRRQVRRPTAGEAARVGDELHPGLFVRRHVQAVPRGVAAGAGFPRRRARTAAGLAPGRGFERHGRGPSDAKRREHFRMRRGVVAEDRSCGERRLPPEGEI
jgi:hypothetical protein